MDSNEDWIIWNASNLLNTIDINQQVRLNICTIFCLISISQCFIFMVVGSIRKKYFFIKEGEKGFIQPEFCNQYGNDKSKIDEVWGHDSFCMEDINFVKTK